jgi:phosphoribosylanthranilate isomerase
MFKIKICGITTVSDAQAAVAAGADAIGLNFYERSSRFVRPSVAADIAKAIRGQAVAVGVFVNSAPDEVRAIAQQCQLDLVQLHGDEPPTDIRTLAGLRVMRAFRIAGDLDAASRYLDVCRQAVALPIMVLADAAATGVFGGSGKALDWKWLADGRAAFHGLPLVLAGGLHAGNVAAAIGAVRPAAVDVASGVEDAPGKKSVSQMQAFVKAARQAFAADEPSR